MRGPRLPPLETIEAAANSATGRQVAILAATTIVTSVMPKEEEEGVAVGENGDDGQVGVAVMVIQSKTY